MRNTAQLKQFDASNGFVEVESDIDHTFRTAQFIKGDFRVSFRKKPDDLQDEKVQVFAGQALTYMQRIYDTKLAAF